MRNHIILTNKASYRVAVFPSSSSKIDSIVELPTTSTEEEQAKEPKKGGCYIFMSGVDEPLEVFEDFDEILSKLYKLEK